MCVPGCRRSGRPRAVAPRVFSVARLAAAFGGERRRWRNAASPGSIDLTHTLSPAFPTFFGVPGIEIEQALHAQEGRRNVNWWRVLEHAGTHMDAPFHYRGERRRRRGDRGRTAGGPAGCRRRLGQGGAQRRLRVEQAGSRRVGRQERPAAGRLLRRDAFRLGAHVRRCREIRRQGRRRRLAFSRHRSRKPPNGCSRSAASSGLRSIRCRSIRAPRRTSGPTRSGCLPAAGVSRTSPTWTRCRPTGATLVAGVPKVQGATGAPARIFALV